MKANTTHLLTAQLRRLALSLLAVAAMATTAIAENEKRVTATSASYTTSLEFDFYPVKPSFDVSDPLVFNLHANRDVFLYVYTVTREGDYALILPNHVQKQNKYPANTTLKVPNRNVAFMADGSVAEEPVYAIASTRYVELDIAKQRKFGNFAMIKEADMTKRFGDKGIILRDIAPGQSETQVITENRTGSQTQPSANRETAAPIIGEASLVRVDVPIENHHAADTHAGTPTASTPTASTDPLITFVSTDRIEYNPGDTVHILFGASKAGKIELYLIDPDGSGDETPILTRDVDGKGYSRVSATHDGSTGAHTIRAVYVAADGSSKGLRLNSPTEQAAVHSQAVVININ